MRGIWAGSPALVLGLLAAGVQADDRPKPAVIASSAAVQPAAVAPSLNTANSQTGRPAVIAASSPTTAPAVSLGRPMAASPAGVGLPALSFDPQLQPVAFTPSLPTVRAKGLDVPQPLPSGQPMPSDAVSQGPSLLDVAQGSGLTSQVVKPSLGQPIAANPTPFVGPEGGMPVFGDGGFASDPWCGCYTGATCAGDNPCLPPCCGSGGLPGHLFWLRAEYLLWNISNSHTPALVTTGPPASLGVIGNTGTSVLFGGSIHHEELSGGRFTGGLWLDANECFGLEGSYFFIGPRSVVFNAASNGNPVLARPFFDISPPPAESAEQVANPALPGVLPLTGRVNVNLSTQFQGAELNGICNGCRSCWGRWDWIAGFRYLRLRDSLNINEDLLVPPSSPLAAGQRIQLNDHFDTRNQFYGGQVGFRTESRWRNWQLDFLTKVALGTTHEQLNIGGSTLITPAGGSPSAFAGGLLAQPTNIGHYTRDRFAVVPELGINLGYQFTDHWRAFVGYNAIYWSTVARPGDQIDRVVNSSLIPPRQFPAGPARPAVNFKDTDFWAYGVNFGVEFRY